jgi:predicted DNA-binding transcriptional regulator AlpA
VAPTEAAPTKNFPDNSTAIALAEKFMSQEEVAELLGVSVATLLRWHHAGKGPPRVKIGRQIYYDATSAEDFMSLEAARGLRTKRRNRGRALRSLPRMSMA